MTLDLDPIRARSEADPHGHVYPGTYTDHYRRDVPALLAEIERRGRDAECEVERLRAEVARVVVRKGRDTVRRKLCPSCERDLSYPGQPGHDCYTLESNVPKDIRRVHDHEITRLQTTIRDVQTYQIGPTNKLESDLESLTIHRNAVSEFANRMKFGSATGYHTEQVLDWLIEQGWTPPVDTFLFEENNDRT